MLSAQSKKLIFSARDLTKVYQMGEVQVQALHGINLEIFAGEVVVLLGASGSGKSTLVNILGGLDTASGGQVTYRDIDLTNASEKQLTNFRRLNVGFVFQFYNLIPSLTARENVAIVTEIAEHPMTPEEALTLVDLSDRMDHFPAQMSGGEQQRVAPETDLDSLNPEDELGPVLDIDSMDFYTMMVGISEDLQVEIPEQEYGNLRTLKNIREFLRKSV